MPLRGPQLAYYMKKRNPELYRKARELKERYGATWDEAFAILRGEKPLPTQATATGSEVQSTLDEVVRRVEALENVVSGLRSSYTNLLTNNLRLNSIANMLSMGLDRRFKFKEYYCVFMDGEGYCKCFYWTAPLKDCKMREVVEDGEKRYYINVKVHRWVCALCPNYIPKYLGDMLSNLQKSLDDLRIYIESLESQISQLQESISKGSLGELRGVLKS